jgi:hypothetical protein
MLTNQCFHGYLYHKMYKYGNIQLMMPLLDGPDLKHFFYALASHFVRYQANV